MFNQTRHQINNWRWDNPRAFRDQVDHSIPQTTSFGKIKHTGEHFSWYGSVDLRSQIKPPSCWQYKTGDFMAVRPLNCDGLIDKDDDDDNWEDPEAPSGGRSCPVNGNENDNGESAEDMLGAEMGTRKGKGTNDRKGNGKGKGKGKGKGNGKGKGIVKHTPGGDDLSCAVAVQLLK
jgi:hypothetical protein